MPLRLRPLAVTACLLAAVACDAPVDVSGSIFLKNDSGGVTTFPLVQVNIYTEAELQALAAARKQRAIELRDGAEAGDTAAANARIAWTLLDSLPTAAITAKSDAEGRFPLTLAAGQRYLAMARASTTVNVPYPVVREWYVWFTPSKENARLLLANDNEVSTATGRRALSELGALVKSATGLN